MQQTTTILKSQLFSKVNMGGRGAVGNGAREERVGKGEMLKLTIIALQQRLEGQVYLSTSW